KELTEEIQVTNKQIMETLGQVQQEIQTARNLLEELLKECKQNNPDAATHLEQAMGRLASAGDKVAAFKIGVTEDLTMAGEHLKQAGNENNGHNSTLHAVSEHVHNIGRHFTGQSSQPKVVSKEGGPPEEPKT